MKKLIGVVLLLAALLAAAVAYAAETYTVSSTLKPGLDVPRPKGAAGAHGAFAGTFVESKTGATLKWKLTLGGLTGPALQAHIHQGKPGVSGNVIVPLCGPCHSGMTGTMHITKAVVEAMEKGNAYVNVHTKKNPAGEVRGQVKVTG